MLLTEDQTVSIRKIGEVGTLDKLYELPNASQVPLTRVKWNPYNYAEIFAFSENNIMIIKHTAPASNVLLQVPVPEGISDLFLIPKAPKCIKLASTCRYVAANQRNQ